MSDQSAHKQMPIIEVNNILTQAFIDGQFCDAESGRTFETINPASGKVIATIAESDEADVNKAVAAARRSFEQGTWRNMLAVQRKKHLQQLSELIYENVDELAASIG